MKNFAILLLFSTVALAQNVRFDAPFTSINSQTAQPFVVANIPPNSPTLSVCHSPANQVPCTNFVTTFNGLGAACPNGAQDTPQPATTSSCQTTGDAQGNIGFWIPAGTYDYTVCVATTCFGPFTVTLGSSGGGAANPGGSPFSIQTNVANTSFGGTNIGQGQAIVGTTGAPIAQSKNPYDVRDFMTCDGVTNATGPMGSLINTISSLAVPATVNITGPCNVAVVQQPANVTFNFGTGGSIKLIPNTTPPGTASFVQGSGQSNAAASPTSTCTATLTGVTAGDAIVAMVSLYNTFGPDNARITSVVDNKDLFIQQVQSTLGFAAYIAVYVASSVQGGTTTVTANFSHAEKNSCIFWEVSGQGPVVSLDASNINFGTTTPFAAGPVSLAAGDFVVMVGEDPNDPQTCTAGAGYTQPAGTAGNVGTASTNGVAMCAEYINSGAGGSTSATQNFSSSPVLSSWGAILLGLKPGLATYSALGGINDPDLHQICVNCTGTSGIMDFTGNLAINTVYPEWWGANGGPTQSAATNTSAMQAAIIGAFGSKRVNGSGANIYNKQLTLTGNYQINGELQFYHVIGNAQTRNEIWCAPGGGITQTAANARILDGQSDAYLRFDNCAWSGTTSSTKPLIDLDFSGAQGADLAPQFIDFYSNSFQGNSVVDVGVLIAKTGGSAQGSNIYCYDCAGSGFTGAVWQVGGNNTARNAGRFYATNALAIGWYGGDMQNCPLYGFASYGGGYEDFHATSFECNSPLASHLTTAATGVDVYCEGAQGPCSLDHVRSEDFNLVNASSPRVYDSQNTDQSTAFYSPVNCIAGGSEPLNWFIHGSDIGSDGAVYQVTVHGTAFGGYCLFHGSSGTGTTIVDTNQNVPGTLTIGTPVVSPSPDVMTQAVTGSTGTLLVIPVSTGTITGSVTSGTIVAGDTVTQAVTSVTCKVVTPAPTGSQNLLVNACSSTADNSHVWTDGGTGGTYTPTSAPSFSAASPQMLITAATGSPDGTHNWVGSISGAVYVPSGVPVNEVNWTTNQFVGSVGAQSQVTFWGGTGVTQICSPITANSATSITFTACTSNYYNAHAANADTSTTAIVEPCWQCGNVTQSGNFTFVKVNPEIIGGDNAQPNNLSSGCVINQVTAAGGKILCNGNDGNFTTITGLDVTRPDWLGIAGGGGVGDVIASMVLNNVKIVRPYSVPVNPSGGQTPPFPMWQLAPRNANTNFFVGPLQTQAGTSPLVWSTSKFQGGTGANDCFVGGRSDPAAGTDNFRNRVELGCIGSGVIGAPAPNTFNEVNLNGAPTQIGGGPSTGTGSGGNIEFWLGSSGSAGTAVNTGVRMWFMDSLGNLTNDATHNQTGVITAPKISPALFASGSNCQLGGATGTVSPAACGSAAAGMIAIPSSQTTYTVDTSAVTLNSEIIIQQMTDNTGLPSGPTCNSGAITPIQSSRSAGVSFTFSLSSVASVTCFKYWIIN